MSSKRVALPSLNSTSKKDALKPVKVQRYRAGQVPEGYVDPALESSDDEEEETAATGRGGLAKAGRINVSIAQDEQPRVAYQVLNVEQMTKQRQLERVTSSGTAASAEGDRRLARLQAIHLEDRRSRGDTKSRRRREDSDDSDEQDKDEAQGEEEDDEEAAARRREAARARAMRGDDEQELWEQGEEEEEEEDHADRKSRAKRDGEESEGSSEYTSGSEEESEDEIASRRKLMKPVFVPKSQRITIDEVKNPDVAFELAEKARLEAIEERKKESHELLKQYIARQAEVEEVPDTDNLEDVDDTDGLDEEAEFEQWKLRELKRIKRDREELEA
ncbi:hypothetical protein BX616_003359 [Lobosporangium transversale]|nr:hypothetical protein BX616_003359 [Lobosporangium transversale]